MINVQDGNLKPEPISKLLKVFLTFTFFAFSMDFGLYKYKSRLAKIVTRFSLLALTPLMSLLIMIFYVPMNQNNIVWYLKFVLESYINILILLTIPENKSFYVFLKQLHSIDLELGVDSNSYRLDIKILLYYAASVAYKFTTLLVYCFHMDECLKPFWIQVLYFLPYSSMDIPLIILFFILYGTHCRLIALKRLAENRCNPLHFQYIYKSLIETIEIAKDSHIPIYIITLVLDIPNLMAVIYDIIKDITHGENDLMAYASEVTVVLSLLIIIFAPAIAGGCLSREVEKIKICFHNYLLQEKDPQTVQDLQKLINYIDARPFKFRLLGIIPMDASLPISIINLSITYIIISLQLTHLY